MKDIQKTTINGKNILVDGKMKVFPKIINTFNYNVNQYLKTDLYVDLTDGPRPSKTDKTL